MIGNNVAYVVIHFKKRFLCVVCTKMIHNLAQMSEKRLPVVRVGLRVCTQTQLACFFSGCKMISLLINNYGY